MIKKKLLLSVLAITAPVVIAPFDGPTYELEAANSKKVFIDITTKNPNYDIIHEMAAQDIIKGYSTDNTFRGGNTITRYQVAALVFRYLGDTLEVVNPNVAIPSDVSPKSEHYKATVALLKAGLLQANESGKLNPNKPITRAEMAKVLVKAFDVKIKADYDFADTIDGDEETRDYVRALYSNGITTGYLSDATFRPEKSLTRQQFAVFMHRSINVDPEFVAPPIKLPDDSNEKEPTEKPVEKPNLVINPPSENYNRYGLDNAVTPLSELANLPATAEAIDVENIVYNPSITGMTLEEHQAYTNEVFDSYSKVMLSSIHLTLGVDRLSSETFINNHLKYFNNSKEQLLQAFYYAYSTGAVYKGEAIMIKFNYSSKGIGGGFRIERNERYGK